MSFEPSSYEIVTIPCLSDNYAFLLMRDGKAVVVDIPEAQPILDEVLRRGVTVTDVLITHHHDDHIQGLSALLSGLSDSPRVIGAGADAHRLPSLDVQVSDGDVIDLGIGAKSHVIDVSGHTVGHIAFHVPEANAAFTADSLMALGCGRVFEGTMDQMWASLSKLVSLPTDTVICSGHEYTLQNGRFALTIEPENKDLQARFAQVKEATERGIPTVPSTLSEELATNPFVRAHLAGVKIALNMTGSSDAEVFGEIRRRKDSF